MAYYIGIDGGGTKTKFTLFDENLTEISSTILPTTHIAQAKASGLRDIMRQGISFFNLNEKPILCVSLAGYGIVRAYCDEIEGVFKEYFSEYTYYLMSDSVSAYFGARGNSEGGIIIAGTGSIGLCYKDRVFKRVGGFGWNFSDEGSGYFIGQLLIRYFLKQSDGRIEKTKLYNHIKTKLELIEDGDILIRFTNEREKTASLSLDVYLLAKMGDKYALEILDITAKELALMANTLATSFKEITISFIGGVSKSFDILLPMIKKYSSEHIRYEKPLYTAEYGAVLAYLDMVKNNEN